MTQTAKKFSVVVVGGGASGLMAAIATKKKYPDYSVVIIEKSFLPGRKLAITGAGRCNLANVNLADNPASYYHGQSEVIKAVFQQFDYSAIIKFFADLGIATYQENKNDTGKIFPINDSAKTVLELLIDEVKLLGGEFLLQTEVKKIKKINSLFKLSVNGPHGSGEIFAEKVILAAGGKTYPALGADGSGYELARSMGHTVCPLAAAGVPVVAKNPLSQLLQKTKVNLQVTCLINGRPAAQVTDDVMFTSYGLSGTAILRVSRPIALALQKTPAPKISVVLNFFPGQKIAEVKARLCAQWQRRPRQTLEKSLLGFWPPKVPAALLKVLKINPNLPVKDLSQAQTKFLLEQLTAYEITVNAVRGWNEAEFTIGGVPASEVKTQTLESKKVPGLYLAGEVLDVDGPLGGYNLAWAWASGQVAGRLQK
jgi:hypothetical protein